ncbi:SDR family NAD(P)-dependent oxidoreductase [Virgibacillus salexigens]|uniref:3-oxoacyl-[acyl-carrier-protein] reductase FabG n=1 Tax=Virgibacillus massiliensis TaxID=1462526 RepID=A0A024QDN3_9BACI|nr:SDR family oxidoreductase [Virgibacillus massiliensis]CDQ40357.1 3-oxoacyl-[acyl-carrier-protein] reductase FabG [Virgibacillus massiliensis]
MSFQGRTIIVTGAGGGMGRAFADLLLNEDANVVGCDLHLDNDRYQAIGNFLAVQGDLLQEGMIEDVLKETTEAFGEIDGLVNFAGTAQAASPVEEVSLAEWHRIMNMNMTMTFLTCQAAASYMKKRKRGSIVNIGSVSTTRPRTGLQAYIASKGAVESFTKALALELAPYHVNVNIVHPGPSDTGMLGKFTKAGGDVEQSKRQVFEQSVPLGKLLQPVDIAHTVKFLLSDEAAMITGSVVHVDGGRNI